MCVCVCRDRQRERYISSLMIKSFPVSQKDRLIKSHVSLNIRMVHTIINYIILRLEGVPEIVMINDNEYVIFLRTEYACFSI